ncbi:MAG: DUF669 domain-containing protein [Pseudomonadota bacterium]
MLVDFKADDLPDNEFKPIPNGLYTVAIVGAEFKDNKAGNGKNLALTYQITEGEQAKRQHREWLPIKNPEEIAQNIALAKLKDVMKSVDVGHLTDSSQLLGKKLKVNIKVTGGDFPNEITEHLPINQLQAVPNGPEAPPDEDYDDDIPF